jgi:hypothetical protein
MLLVYGFILIGLSLLIWAWVKGVDYMVEDEIDVDENDFLTSAGRDGWDDNAVHSEGDF